MSFLNTTWCAVTIITPPSKPSQQTTSYRVLNNNWCRHYMMTKKI